MSFIGNLLIIQNDLRETQGVLSALLALLIFVTINLWLHGLIVGMAAGVLPGIATALLIFVLMRCRLPVPAEH
ncbi:hypothetical protein HMPREF9946_02545 [Acetobacteraceae bacterium AT-5844]|nr:hypothetical protein HMPREF9946_02545 [Acetobacteraceae bacterium AT-5844]